MNDTPLTRENATTASRVMLPFYVFFNLLLGVTWTFQDERRSSSGLIAIREWMPIDVMGSIVIAVGAAIGIGLLTRNRAIVAFTLVVAQLLYVAIGVAIIWSLHPSLDWRPWPYIELSNTKASLSGCYWLFALATAYFASMKSILADEYTDIGVGNRVH